MKILFLSDYFSSQSVGGAGIVSYADAKALADRGHDVSVITASTKKEDAGVSVTGGIRVYTLYSDYGPEWRAYVSIFNPPVIREVKRIIREARPEVIHAYNIHTYISYYALKIARRSGAKVFITMHDVMAVHYGKFTDFIDPRDLSVPAAFDYRIRPWSLVRTFRWRFNPFRNMAIRHYLRYADRIFAVSGALKKVLNDNGIGNVEILYNSLDFASWTASPEDVARFKAVHGLENRRVVLFSGWITAAKGGDQILAAFKKVCEKIPDAILLCAGRTDLYYQDMKREAGRMGLGARVSFPGWIGGADLAVSYAACDVAVFPSVCFDTFGMVNLEAMASKKPVIATCFGGAPEVVADGKTGYIVNPYDTETMADRIVELLTDTDRARAFGVAGYERAVKLFNKEDKMRELISWYQR